MTGHRDTIDKLRFELAEAHAELSACRSATHGAQANLDALLQASRHRALIVDPSGIVLAANKSLAASVGLKPRDMKDKSLGLFLPEDIFQARLEQIRTVAATGLPVVYQDTRNGMHLKHSHFPVIENGEVVRVAIYVEDISSDLAKDAELEKASRLHSLLYEISLAGRGHDDLHDALHGMHMVLEREFDMRNFFVALINEDADTLEFRYCADQTLSKCPTVVGISSEQNKRLSLLPIRRGDMVLADKAELERLKEEGEVQIFGVIPETWLGIPLTIHGKTIGVMVSQDYDNQRHYSGVEIQLIRVCADQLARTIEQVQYEELFRFTNDIYRNIPSGLIIYRYEAPDRLYLLDGNRRAEEITGTSLEDKKGLEFAELWPEADKAGIRELLLTPVREGRPFFIDSLSYEGRRVDGMVRVIAFALPGNRIGVSFEDVTEEKKGEIAIRESEEYFRAFYEHNHTVMLILDPETGGILDANLAAENYYGYSKETLLEMAVKDLNTMDPAKIIHIMGEISSKRLKRLIARHRLANGELRDVEIFSGPFEFEGKLRLVSIVHDITDRLKAEAALSAAKESAEQANRSKDEFLANISHEVRTPLNGVMGMLQLMQRTSLDQEQTGFVRTALQSSRNLLRVLNDLLDFSKIEAGKLELYHEPFDLERLISESVDLFRQQAEAAGLDLSWKIEEGTGRYFNGDGGRLRQVLFNLIGNAIKFTERGFVHISAYTLPLPGGMGMRLFCSVEDSGVGIPSDKIDYIFESFSQVDGSLTRKYQGTGLGLPIVKRLVNLMGGTISVDSAPGIGTTLLVSARVEPSEPVKTAVEPPKEDSPSTPLRILLAEDEEVNRLMATRLLEKIGHTVERAEDGAVCLDKLKSEPFDLVLMDIQMPLINGLEAAQIIRTKSEFSHVSGIPIIALTAHASKGDKETAFRMGMNGYICKPFDLDELRQIIASFAP